MANDRQPMISGVHPLFRHALFRQALFRHALFRHLDQRRQLKESGQLAHQRGPCTPCCDVTTRHTKTPCLLSHWCFVTRSLQVKINYLRSLSRVTVPRLFTYASNDEMVAYAAQSWLRDHWPHRIRIPGNDISSAPNWIKVKFHTLGTLQ